jgi:Tfp pilus assembly protein FimT
MVVTAIVGMIVAVGIPAFITYWRNSTLTGGAQELTVLLNSAREVAIKENTTVCVKSNAASGSSGTKVRYLLSTCTGTAWTGAGTDATGYMTLSSSIQLQAPATDVAFTNLGRANPSGSFIVRNPMNNGTATVTVATSGRVRTTYP